MASPKTSRLLTCRVIPQHRRRSRFSLSQNTVAHVFRHIVTFHGLSVSTLQFSVLGLENMYRDMVQGKIAHMA
jgi:hypothetical protein